jgi:hypothetical protein
LALSGAPQLSSSVAGLRAFEVRRELPAAPGSKDPFKLDSQIWLELEGGAPELAAHGPAFEPEAVRLPDGGALVVFRLDGLKPAPPPPAGASWTAEERYARAREGGGASVGYAYRSTAGEWRRGYVARATEILVRDRMEQDQNAGRIYPSFGRLGLPALGLDSHGVAWCTWANPLRRHVYSARWLGPDHGFSAPFEVTRAQYGLGEHVGPDVQVGLRAEEAPVLSTAERRRVLFVDLLEVAELRGVEHRLGKLVKRPKNPIVTPEWVAEQRKAEVRPLGAPRVWRDSGRVLMELGARGPMGNGVSGRLESDDGLNWRWCAADEQGIEIDGERSAPGDCTVTWFLDEAEPDASRRYKGALIRGQWTKDPRRWLVTSGDGVRWRTEAEMVGMHHLAENGGPCFRDPRSGEYVAVGRTSASGHRALGMLRSRDLILWEGDEPLRDVDDPFGTPPQLRRGHPVAGRILDPAGEPNSEQIYWGTVWPEQGLYLCLYGRYHWDARYEACLAVSRDGRTFSRVCPDQAFLPVGGAGEWDSGIVFMDFGVTRPVPFPDKGLVRLYYAGSTWRHSADPYRVPAAVGAADLCEDGWAYLTPDRDSPLPAMVITIPVRAEGRVRLRVNADGPVAWDVLDLDGAVLFEAGEMPVSGAFRLRFQLQSDRSRLYSFWFEEAG